MSFQPTQNFEGVAIEPERALNIGVGVAAAPLWAAFYASAGFGAAWWWSTAWTRATPSFDVEKLLAPQPAPAPEPEPAPAAQPPIEALDEAAGDRIETTEPEAEEAVEVAEAVHDSVELAGDTAVESVSYVVEQAEEAIAETLPTETGAEPLTAASEGVATLDEIAAEPAELTQVAEQPSFKPSKKKAPKAEA